MAAITQVSTLSEKSADISKWFDELVSSIRVEEMQIVSGIAPKEKQDRVPLLKKLAQGREISGLAAYE